MKLSRSDIDRRLQERPGWALEGDTLVRLFEFPSFPDAIAFATRLAFDAEAHDHHPDLLISYRRVRVAWRTHSEGGVTDRDFTGVADSDAIAARWLA
jgi:4a-hydroxytetrahydrobiopterin dehydratase